MLKIADLNYSFVREDKTLVTLFDKFGVEFDNGITSIVGRNGVGKSTLFQCIVKDFLEQQNHKFPSNIIFPDNSTLKLIHQKPSLSTLGWYNSIQNLQIIDSFTPNRISQEVIDNYTESIISFGIDPYSKLGTLSGGQLQVINILKSVAISPTILLLDEPFGALDIENSYRLKKYLRTWQQNSNSIVILISHSIGDIIDLSDMVIFMDNIPVIITNSIQSTTIKTEGKQIISKFFEQI
jgi:NitT/TauT family transport system ATP-binding protein